MKIELKQIKISELVEGYVDNGDEGVRAYGGRLDVRPPYQREFVYGDKERKAVINTIMSGFPLNTMYWAKRNDGTFEIIDGQQRTLSICQYWGGVFSVEYDDYTRYYHNLDSTPELKQRFDDYELMVYICEGTDEERLAWFRTINIAGMALTEQELRNAVYAGPWVTDAKRYFSKANCVAKQRAGDYLDGDPKRQAYMEKVIGWIVEKVGIENYMARHQYDPDAQELKDYFLSVFDWVEKVFKVKRRQIMKGQEWGVFYNEYKDKDLNPDEIEKEIKALLTDEDVQSKKGIYRYILTREERYLNLRAFSESQKMAAYEKQHGCCAMCHEHFEYNEMHGDHIIPWSKGGHTVPENCQMLCRDCNLKKSDK